jgi:hypothetical protein
MSIGKGIAEMFEEWLVEHETACNIGNWMWLSCTAFLVRIIVYIVQLLLEGRRTSKVRCKAFSAEVGEV